MAGMKITEKGYEKIAHCLPKQRGNVKIDNLTFINALLYICENGCKWRALPSEFGNWHVICVRLSRWVEKGIIERLFRELQQQEIIKISFEKACLDSTSIKVHPNGTGAKKKEASKLSGAQKAETTPKFIWYPQMTGLR